jgi:hypothetical protein
MGNKDVPCPFISSAFPSINHPNIRSFSPGKEKVKPFQIDMAWVGRFSSNISAAEISSAINFLTDSMFFIPENGRSPPM